MFTPFEHTAIMVVVYGILIRFGFPMLTAVTVFFRVWLSMFLSQFNFRRNLDNRGLYGIKVI